MSLFLGKYRPYRLCNVISLASVPNCKSCCKKLAFKERWWPQGSPSKGKVRRGPRRRSRSLFRWWTLNRELWTRPQDNISPPFATSISFKKMAYIYVYLVNTDTHILGYFVSLLLYSWNGEIVRTFFAAMY